MATHMRPDGHWGGCLNVRLESLHVLALSYFLESLKTELRSAQCCDRKVRERGGVKITMEDFLCPISERGAFRRSRGLRFLLTLNQTFDGVHGHPPVWTLLYNA